MGMLGGCNLAVLANKVYDSCKSKECIRDLRVYLTAEAQEFIDRGATSVKARQAELLCVCIDVEKVPFNRGFYTVDVRFFYRVVVEASCPGGRPQIIDGLAVFDKRAILFGSEGGARIFSSKYVGNSPDIQMTQRTNMPIAVVDAADIKKANDFQKERGQKSDKETKNQAAAYLTVGESDRRCSCGAFNRSIAVRAGWREGRDTAACGADR